MNVAAPPAFLRAGRRRGAAYAEALLVIAFCSVVWASVVYATRLHLARQQVRLTARHCAWTVAVAGCREIPAECRGAGISRGPGDPELQGELSVGAEGVGAESVDDGDGITASGREAVEAAFEGLLFERISVEGTRSVRRPLRGPLRSGGEVVQVGARYTLPCNSRPTSVARHARDAFGRIIARVF